MKQENGKQPAFAKSDSEPNYNDGNDGLTKREYLAAMAMQGILMTQNYSSLTGVAKDALVAADALLKELEQ